MPRNEITSRRGEAFRRGVSQSTVTQERRRLAGLSRQGSIGMQGADAMAKVLQKMPSAIAKAALDQATRKGAKVLRDEMEERRISKGWELEGGFVVKRDRDNSIAGQRSSFVIAPPADAFYMLFLEFGTVKQPAQPVMRPATDEKRDEAVQALGQQLGKAIEREAEKLAGQFGALGKTRRRRLGRS